MKKVMIFGTFDIIHLGHLNLFNQAKKYGDYLIIVVADDENVKANKGKHPRNNQRARIKQIKNLNIADKVIAGLKNDVYQLIKAYQPDVICLGYDQRHYIRNLAGKLKQFGLTETKIVRLKPFKPAKYKSSIFRND